MRRCFNLIEVLSQEGSFRSTSSALFRVRSALAALLVFAAILFVPAVVADSPPAVDAASAASSSPTPADFGGDVIYQIITDRFFDGDSTNNDPATSPNLYSADRSNWRYYWGGDWSGIAAKISYLKNMGVTALWISPAVQNANVPVPIGTESHSGYHGYWGMDFFRPEPHFGTWTDFDNMVATAHANGIKIVLDFAPNHSNPAEPNDPNYAKDGRVYRDGTELVRFSDDASGWFHHNGSISDYGDLYQVQYRSIVNLADFATEATPANAYLRDAIAAWLGRGVDGIRMDAVKLMPLGWLKSYNDHIFAGKTVYVFGEWFDGSSSALWPDLVKFANTSGMALANFDLNGAIRTAFASGGSMVDLDAAVRRSDEAFTYQNQQVNFVDNHDIARFLSINNNQTLLDQAMVFTMNARGVPAIYYGTEQYLHNDTNGGGDPYNRPMMSTFSETTRGYRIVQKLSALRRGNPALRYGSIGQRWLNGDVYVFERKFYDNAVLTAINKSTTASYDITSLYTSLAPGTYSDVLEGLLGGGSISVSTGSGGNNPVGSFTLGPGKAAVWSYVASEPAAPQVGDVTPVMGRAGVTATVAGKGFGSTAGSVTVGGASATVAYWSPAKVDFQIPAAAPTGKAQVKVIKSDGTASNGIEYNVLTGAQVPVTFNVNNAPPTNFGDNVYVTGSVPELGNWSTDKNVAVGRLLAPNYPNWFGMASLPAGRKVEYKFIVIRADGSVVWENGLNHTYAVPTSGVGSVTVDWQY